VLRALDEKKNLNTIRVDLGEEDGRGTTTKRDSKNVFGVIIEHTAVVDFSPLLNLIKGTNNNGAAARGAADWSQALTMLDHVIHMRAKEVALVVKRSIFPPNAKQQAEQTAKLGRAVLAYRGIHVSFKAALHAFQQGRPQRTLAVNIDATCVTFWEPGPLKQVIYNFLGYSNPNQFQGLFANAARGKTKQQWESSDLYRNLMKMKNLRVTAYHLKDPKGQIKDKQFSIKNFCHLPPQALTFTVEEKKSDDGKSSTIKSTGPVVPPGEYTILSYFQRKHPDKRVAVQPLPCVEFGNGNIMMIECLHVVDNQKYNHKLDGQQTSKMLTLAAQLPQLRKQAISNGVGGLKWAEDPWLKQFALKVNPAPSKVQGRLLECPSLEFQQGKKIGPDKTKGGRWIIQNMKFVKTNADSKQPITSWGVFVIRSERGPVVSVDEAKQFAQTFQRTYVSHGGVFSGAPQPYFYINTIQNMGDKIQDFVDQTTKAKGNKPQILFFILGDRSPDVYNAIKKSMDCRFGIASQCVQAGHVKKNQGQYHSNVCLKVNAKLGGATTYARGKTPLINEAGFYNPNERVMVIGADVTHGAPGADQNSFACLTMSKDHTLNHYMAAVEVNGLRQDIIHREAMNTIFGDQLDKWIRMNNGKMPKRILYFRDGVSREATKEVLDVEVAQIKDTLLNKLGNNDSASGRNAAAITFTVVIATKRHHTRIFPERGDRNNNAFPGTLVELGAGGAVDLDWFMISHVALKGTARPMHYNVVLDENNYKMEALQQFIHEACFQYIRATTPVSQFPAIYYSHIASRRGVIHEGKPLSAQSGGKKEIDAKRLQGISTEEALAQHKLERSRQANVLPPVRMDPVPGILADHMWFI
jgi:eukaryotic translation initiation factor 2C